MVEDVNSRVRRIAEDRTSGASEILQDAVEVVRTVLENDLALAPVAIALLRAQPSMASMWNLIRHALAAGGDAAAVDRYLQQVARAPRALVRHAGAILALGRPPGRPLNVVTISFSGTATLVLQSLVDDGPVHVACAEGQPALEGRRMAQRLAGGGITVTHYTDAALGQALRDADAVLAGADAITPEWILNKSGTGMLAAAAVQQGVPVYVVATRDKFLSQAVGSHLAIREESPAEVWPSPPPGVTVRNRYFEAIPLDLVTAVISDIGVLGAALVPGACTTADDALLLDLVSR